MVLPGLKAPEGPVVKATWRRSGMAPDLRLSSWAPMVGHVPTKVLSVGAGLRRLLSFVTLHVEHLDASFALSQVPHDE
jgi:hypothetical protein